MIAVMQCQVMMTDKRGGGGGGGSTLGGGGKTSMGGLARDSCTLAAGGDRLDPLLLPLLGCCILLGEEVLLHAQSVFYSHGWMDGWMDGWMNE